MYRVPHYTVHVNRKSAYNVTDLHLTSLCGFFFRRKNIMLIRLHDLMDRRELRVRNGKKITIANMQTIRSLQSSLNTCPKDIPGLFCYCTKTNKQKAYCKPEEHSFYWPRHEMLLMVRWNAHSNENTCNIAQLKYPFGQNSFLIWIFSPWKAISFGSATSFLLSVLWMHRLETECCWKWEKNGFPHSNETKQSANSVGSGYWHLTTASEKVDIACNFKMNSKSRVFNMNVVLLVCKWIIDVKLHYRASGVCISVFRCILFVPNI